MRLGRNLLPVALVLSQFVAAPAPAFVLLPEPPAAGFVMNLNLGTTQIQTIGYGLIGWNKLAESALAEWNRVGIGSGPDFGFFKVRNPAVAGNACARDGINEVRWASNLCGFSFGDAVAVTRRWTVNGVRVEAEVLFNSNVPWNAYPARMVLANGGGWLNDFYRVALHEFGHVAGLDHPDEAGQSVKAVMNATVSDIDSLQPDDIAGAHAVAWAATSVTSTTTVATTTTTTQPASAALEMRSYFPFQPGYEWTYQDEIAGSVTTYKRSVAQTQASIGGVGTFVWTDSKGVSRYMTNDADGVRRHAALAQGFVSGHGSVSITTSYSPPEMYSPASVALGGSVSQAGTASHTLSDGSVSSSTYFNVVGFEPETVAVPAGTFDTVRITSVRVSSAAATTDTLWVANGVGIVKLRYDSADGTVETFSLASINFTPALGTVALNLVAGWNLAGNGSSGALDLAAVFGDPAKVLSVWKWNAGSARWALYTPSLAGQALADYASSRGYEVLATISGGEGFWVNARTNFTAQLPAGTAITSSALQTMPPGWSLVAIGDSRTPSQFSAIAGAATPLLTLWAWDPVLSNWYFHAPSLEAKGGTALSDYIAGKSYLDFTARNKSLAPGVGFWVNKQ